MIVFILPDLALSLKTAHLLLTLMDVSFATHISLLVHLICTVYTATSSHTTDDLLEQAEESLSGENKLFFVWMCFDWRH